MQQWKLSGGGETMKFFNEWKTSQNTGRIRRQFKRPNIKPSEINRDNINDVTEEADNFINDYVLNDQAYTLNNQSSVENEESVSSEVVGGLDLDLANEDELAVAEEDEPQ